MDESTNALKEGGTESVVLPLCTVQHDWEIDVDDVHIKEANLEKAPSFWISCRPPSSTTTSTHGTIHVDPKSGQLSGSEAFHVVDSELGEGNTCTIDGKCTRDHFSFNFDGFKSSVLIKRPVVTLKDAGAKFESFDYSLSGALFVCGGNNGEATIFETKTYKPLRQLKGHKGPIKVCKFFPSGEVVITGGSDCRARIFSALDGRNPVTFTHGGAVNGISIIEKGRNVLTCSADKHVRLWDCGTQQVLYDHPCVDKVSHIALFVQSDMSQEMTRQPHEREAGTMNKLVLAAANKALLGIDLRMQTQAFHKGQSASLTALCAVDAYSFACGNKRGLVHTWDTRNMKEAVAEITRHDAEITSLCDAGKNKLAIGTADGMCTVLDLTNQDRFAELTGSNLDPISNIAHSRQGPLSVCCPNDGTVRIYSNLNL